MELANKQFSRKTFLSISRNVMPRKILKIFDIQILKQVGVNQSSFEAETMKENVFFHEMYGTEGANIH